MAKQNDKTVLFLCTGNYYRSRFAEILFNSVAAKMGLSWRASSRALALERGVNNIGPMAKSAVKAVEALGIRALIETSRYPAAATLADFEKAEIVVALKQAEHLPLLQERFPDWALKVEFWHVDDDPKALDAIEGEVMRFTARLIGGGQEPPPPVATEEAVPVKKKKEAPGPIVRVSRETKGRRGKGVTIVADVPYDEARLHELAAKLKQRCGTGGTVKDGKIEIQGDFRERLSAELESLGFRVKRAGG
jgi:predicted translation initiation factor SUI1